MLTQKLTHTTKITVALATSLAFVAMAAPAQAKGSDDVVRRGSCTGATDWKVKVGPEDGRLEVEAEVDSNRSGQTWTWSIRHNGALAAKGTRTTAGPSGSFEVRRVLVNRPGADTMTFRARNTSNGEWCTGSVRF